jgi:hypothetical protein
VFLMSKVPLYVCLYSTPEHHLLRLHSVRRERGSIAFFRRLSAFAASRLSLGAARETSIRTSTTAMYRVTSLIRNCVLTRTTVGP